MSSSTNTVKKIFYIIIFLIFNIIFAVEYLIVTPNDFIESANTIADIYSVDHVYGLDAEVVIYETVTQDKDLETYIKERIESDR